MAFDLSTARPETVTGFDLSTAKPEQPQAEPETTLMDVGRGAIGLGGEAVAGFNRGVAKLLDIFTIDRINNIRELMGDEAIPTLADALVGPKGQFTEGTIAEGLLTDIAAGIGETAIDAVTGQGLIKQGAKQLAPLSASTGARVLQQAATPSLTAAAAFGGASGAGEEIGRSVGGEEVALVGAIAAPVAGISALGGAKAAFSKLASRLGKNIELINPETALPTPAFQRALDERGVQYGSIVDDIESLPVLRGKLKPDDVVERILKRKLLTGASDDVTATLRLQGNTIVADELGEEALKQGIKKGNIAAMKSMSTGTKREATKMLNMTRQILANASKADDFRPTDVVGKNVMERFSYIRGKADSLRKQLDKIANKTTFGDKELSGPGVTQGLKGQQLDTVKIESAVLKGLDKLKVNIPDDILSDTTKLNAYLKTNEAFTGSLISENPSSKNVIRKSIKLLSETGQSDASRAHDLKRQLDEMIDFSKASKQGLTESGRSFAKSIRAALNESIREINPQYAKINDELSLSIETMNGFQKVLGPSIDVFDKGAVKAVGQDLRGLLSNRKTRIKLENAVNAIDDTANKLGGNFDISIKSLVRFANTLDDRFGAVADTSLKGEVTGAINQAARGKAGAIDLATQKVAEQAEKLRGVNDRNALNVIQKILMRKQ